VATWAAPPTTIPPVPPTVLQDQTVRHVAHTSIGGDELRIRLTNEFGDTPLRIGEVRVGLGRAAARAPTFRGDTLGFWSAENERKRAAVNRWIGTSGEYDAVIDFDAATRDPADPLRLRPAYDSGDGLHPNDAGMAAMAAAVPVRLFR